MLCDIEIPDSNLLRLEDEDGDDEGSFSLADANRNARNLLETSQAGSVILERCTLDPSMLPVADSSDDDEMQTPMVEIISPPTSHKGAMGSACELKAPFTAVDQNLDNIINNNNLGREVIVNMVKVHCTGANAREGKAGQLQKVIKRRSSSMALTIELILE